MTDTLYGFKKAPELDIGAHRSPQEGMCVMEFISFINSDYEPFSDMPSTVHPQIVTYMQNANDYSSDEERVHLLSVLDRMFHTGNMTLRENWDFYDCLVAKEEEFVKIIGSGDYTFRTRYMPGIWRFLHGTASSDVPIGDKLAVLNLILDCADEALGVTETLPQNREVIEQMLEKLEGAQS